MHCLHKSVCSSSYFNSHFISSASNSIVLLRTNANFSVFKEDISLSISSIRLSTFSIFCIGVTGISFFGSCTILYALSTETFLSFNFCFTSSLQDCAILSNLRYVSSDTPTLSANTFLVLTFAIFCKPLPPNDWFSLALFAIISLNLCTISYRSNSVRFLRPNCCSNIHSLTDSLSDKFDS